MTQQTNLNVSPYFDDFNVSNDYYKVLFKPGYPVQARELTGLQSILQNQIEKFGQHMFKEGAKIIPGNTSYQRQYFGVEINSTHLGVPVESYIDQLVGQKIVGLQSGITAVIDKVLKAEDSERNHTTLYVKYHSSNVNDNHLGVFGDGELLAADSDITSGPLNNAFIPAGESFASAVSSNASSTGTSFSISDGVYFIRGIFVNVSSETIIVSQYTNTPTGRIGLRVDEETINSDEDPTLTDNSKGFNNYAAPGADRLKITCSLQFKESGDFNDDNFVQIAEVKEGRLISHQVNTEYNILADELARRTYAESGDYTVKPFNIKIKDSLDDGISNNGVFEAGQLTDDGALATDDLALYRVSPGKAFVKGYEVERIAAKLKDVEKPRTTKTLESQAVNYKTGAVVRVNRVTGAPIIGVGNTYVVSLRDTRVGAAASDEPGTEIGLARVYDAALESGSYNTSNANVNQWDLSLYDIQTFTTIQLNAAVTLNAPTFIKGKYSGATGFLRSSTTTDALIVYDVAGTFVKNEPFLFNGELNSRVALAVTSFGMGDVKAVYAGPGIGTIGYGVTFTGDVVQENELVFGSATITAVNGSTGISTVTCGHPLFPGDIKIGNLVKFNGLDNNDPTYARVTATSTSNISITGVTTVSGVANGALPTIGKVGVVTSVNNSAFLNTPDLTLITTPFAKATDNTLYTPMPRPMISDVDLSDGNLKIRKIQQVTISQATNALTATLTAGQNETFLPFDEERYSLIRSDGHVEVLTDDRFTFNAGNTELTINNIGTDLAVNRTAQLVTTLTKTKPKAKVKRLNRVSSVIISKSKLVGSGTSAASLGDGLDYLAGYPYGTRVQDEKICLNVPDVISILGIYESRNTSDASAPRMTLSAIDGVTGKTGDLILGEIVTGKDSGAIAVYAEQLSDSQISFCLRNESAFNEGEEVSFSESGIKALITSITEPSNAVGSNFNFNSGQKGTFYDYGFISRKNKAKAPTKRLKVYYSDGYYDADDDGDVTVKNSYNTFNYDHDIQRINGIRNTDMIDIRPRVSNYTVSATNSRSPLEFLGRAFNQSGNSAANILASDEAITTNYSFYLGRMDRIYLTKGGKIKVVKGNPAEKRELPVPIDDALELATVDLPPYLLDVNDASINFLKHKRYRMQDIRKLEKRIQNLEYYTSLSLLETATENLFIPDANGLNKFKSGFFVDNFTEFRAQEDRIRIKNSIDPTNKESRPTHYTNAVDLQIGPVEGDQATLVYPPEPEGTNVKRTGDIITLDYEEIQWKNQPFGTRPQSITPFLVSLWKADIDLIPASDTWVDTVRLDANVIQVEGDYAHTIDVAARHYGGWDPQTGLTPELWNVWETVWTGTESFSTTQNRTEVTGSNSWQEHEQNGNTHTITEFTETTHTTYQDTFTDNWRTGYDHRSGNRQLITEQWDNHSLGDRTVSEELVPFMRSRNIAINGQGFKPLTRLYAFFDRQRVSQLVVPKLLEIEMTTGTFQVGETVIGEVQRTTTDGSSNFSVIQFRVAQCNHKEGPFNEPTRIYAANPYTSSVGPTQLEVYSGLPGSMALGDNTTLIPSSYSSTSTILNIDIDSLANQPQGDYYGWIETGMVLRGQTSSAQAKIINHRLISDYAASVQGSFYIPDPNIANNPRWETGTKTFTLVDQEDNHQSCAETLGEENYEASGVIETVQEDIISVRNARVDTIDLYQERGAREFIGTDVETDVVGSTTNVTERVVDQWTDNPGDPLAQSFTVDEPTGIFVTSCDVYFRRVDPNNLPVVFEIRPMHTGMPTTKVLPFSQIYKQPEEITNPLGKDPQHIIQEDGALATRFTFKAPVYLEGGEEYAVVLRSASNKYEVFVARVGENDLITDEFVSQQPFMGSLFKSQNGSTWDASQWEDLKFVLNRAQFKTEGTLEVYSPILGKGNAQIPKLMPDSINLQSKEIRVGLGTTLAGNTSMELGTLVSQTGSDATGRLAGFAGSCALAAMTVVNSGVGYTDGSFTGIGLTNITGNGSGMKATVVVSSNVVASATVTTPGTGYKVGDVLGFTTHRGVNGRLSVVSLGATNQIILDNVQGDFSTGAGTTMLYTQTTSGITTQMNWGAQRIYGATLDIVTVNDGLHFTVDHKNHGMHHETNRVTLSKVSSDISPTKLSSPYAADSTASIPVDSSSDFSSFENVSVGSTNLGYALIGDEIISYTGASGNNLTGVTRQVDSTVSRNYISGQPVYKYELGGVSLRRFNTTHILSDVGIQTTTNPITFDSYTIKLDTSANTGTARTTGDASFPVLYMNETKSSGGMKATATQNMAFEVLNPQVQNLTVPGTSISGEVRTISGTSLNTGSGQGSDLPFVDKGYEAVALNKNNYLDSPRIIASRVNETNNSSVTDLPGDRSMNLRINLNSENDLISPVIDTQRISAILTSNRVDNMVSNYIEDNRVDIIEEDPNSFQYLSKENVLETSATSIKIIFDAHINDYNDVRALYAISDKENFDPVFSLFPGFNNLNEKGEVIDPSQNDGRSDTLIEKDDASGFTPDQLQYREYTFTINNLPSFKAFRIKLDFTSTNQAFVPRMANLRVITLA